MDKDNYINGIKKVIFTDTEYKEKFKEIQKIANNLRNEYQIAIFEENEKEIEEIDTFLGDILPPVKWGDQIMPFKVLYDMQPPIFKQMFCSYLYDPTMKIQPTNGVNEFIKEYLDIDKFYSELVLVSLFYL